MCSKVKNREFATHDRGSYKTQSDLGEGYIKNLTARNRYPPDTKKECAILSILPVQLIRDVTKTTEVEITSISR